MPWLPDGTIYLIVSAKKVIMTNSTERITKKNDINFFIDFTVWGYTERALI